MVRQGATAVELAMRMHRSCFLGVVRAVVAGDALNLLGYPPRPYEVEQGAVDAAMEECGAALSEACTRYSRAPGPKDDHLSDWEELQRLAEDHYDPLVRGGESYMEVGKLDHFVEDRVNS